MVPRSYEKSVDKHGIAANISLQASRSRVIMESASAMAWMESPRDLASVESPSLHSEHASEASLAKASPPIVQVQASFASPSSRYPNLVRRVARRERRFGKQIIISK